jgi:hypothetical protein
MSDSTDTPPTLENSLGLLSGAISRAAADLLASRNVLERIRTETVANDEGMTRDVVTAAERVVSHLADADVHLRQLLEKLNRPGPAAAGA